MKRPIHLCFLSLALLLCNFGDGFAPAILHRQQHSTHLLRLASTSVQNVETVQDATQVLEEFDKHFNKENFSGNALPEEAEKLRPLLPQAIRVLEQAGLEERNQDSTQGRVMLGICASSVDEGIATLKSWVTNLGLPRGLLHGADEDGVPLEIKGGVYIKYNTGGVMTFSQIRKLGMGFDALWKPGDAMLEPYDGNYRGVYFQVELSDDVFRQYLVPLLVFEDEN